MEISYDIKLPNLNKSNNSFEDNYEYINKNKYLKKSYCKYTDFLIRMEKHIEQLHNLWIIDTFTRNKLLQSIDTMVRNMIKIYNTNVLKNYSTVSNENNVDNKESNRITEIIAEKLFEMGSTENPFDEIHNDIVNICKSNGCLTMRDFCELSYTKDFYYQINCKELFDIYNKVFVPLSIEVKNTKESHGLTVKKTESTCDGLIDNTCKITLIFKNKKKIIFDGYISINSLNIYARTSQIYSEHIFQTKNRIKQIITEKHPYISQEFIAKYLRLNSSNHYFINSAEEYADMMATDYYVLTEFQTKTFNYLMKDFIKGDVKTMYYIINLLLMGTDQNISTAGLLYGMLKDKKIGGNAISDIIYKNLSYYSQIKIKKATTTIHNEIARIKNLSIENISIEKKLSTMTNIPDTVKNYIIEKNNEIKTGENSYKLQTAINGLMQFPWKPLDAGNEFDSIKKSVKRSREYLRNVANKLNTSVYGHDTSKCALVELVGKWIQNPKSSGQVIGLVGPPGVGKTLLAKSISDALSIPLSIIGLGGMSDAADLIGHSFTYAGAQYGMILRQMIKAGSWRSILFFDEVDKVSKRNDTNEIFNTLIHITDPNMNKHFQDRFYSSAVEFDLSGVLIVFSYNDSSKLDPILLDRIKEIKIAAYSTQEKINIAQNYVLKELCDGIGIPRNKLHFEDQIIRYIIEKYTLEAGVRDLKRKLEQILLKFNIDRFYLKGPFKKLLEDSIESEDLYNIVSRLVEDANTKNPENINDNMKTMEDYTSNIISKHEEFVCQDSIDKIFRLEIEDKITIDMDLVHRYLEKPTILVEKIHKTNLVGVINGLYATTSGTGGIIPIQIYKNYASFNDDDHIKLKMTGNQKQVMKESVTCAFTTAINILSYANQRNFIEKFPYGFHIHAPDGGTPKDGPSAGCAFTTAFVSLLLGKEINKEVAMTGEIELTGKISKIGGLDLKLAGAKKAGVKTVYICSENKEDLDTIKKKSPELFEDGFSVKIVDHIIEIISDPNVIIDVKPDDFIAIKC